MKRKCKFLSATMVLLLFMQMPLNVFAFEDESCSADLQDANNVANEVAGVCDNSNVIDGYVENEDSYVVENFSVEYEIPKDGDDNILATIEGDVEISMSLPKELELSEGVEAIDGTIVYNSEDDVSICTQILAEEIAGETITYNRTAVVIENAAAPHDYTFTFELPEGYRLCEAQEYNETQKQYYIENREEFIEAGISEADYNAFLTRFDDGFNEIYIVDSEDNIIEIIEEPWAKDANGNDVNTYYSICDDSVVQTVDFSDSSAFPIIADPSVGATKSFSVKVSNSMMGVPSYGCSTVTAAGKKVLNAQTKKAIIAKVGSKFIPGLNIATWIVTTLGYINGLTGYNGIEVYGTLIYRKVVLHQQGNVYYGWDIKSLKMRRY